MNICAHEPCPVELAESRRGRKRKYCSPSHASLAWQARNREAFNAYQRDYQRKRREMTPEEVAAKSAARQERREKQVIAHRERQQRRALAHPEAIMLHDAKQRAKRYGREFTITEADIVIPELCPVLGIELERGAGKPSGSSPCLDRIDNSAGYVPGNVHVISQRANARKHSYTVRQLAAGRAGPHWKAWAQAHPEHVRRRVVTGKTSRPAPAPILAEAIEEAQKSREAEELAKAGQKTRRREWLRERGF
jgi:hypothetical protein